MHVGTTWGGREFGLDLRMEHEWVSAQTSSIYIREDYIGVGANQMPLARDDTKVSSTTGMGYTTSCHQDSERSPGIWVEEGLRQAKGENTVQNALLDFDSPEKDAKIPNQNVQ